MKYKIVFIGGSACAGKSTIAREIVKNTQNAFLINNDTIKNHLLVVRKISKYELNPELPSIEDYLSFYKDKIETFEDIFGEGIRIPFSSEFYRRHVRDQTYSTMIEVAMENIELGKIPFYESVFPRQVVSGIAGKIIDSFKKYDPCLLWIYLNEDELRKRMVQRAERDETYLMRDEQKISTDSSWNKYIMNEPIIPLQLDEIFHIKIDNSGELTNAVTKALDFLAL